jgi:hypothetical protein
VARVDGDVTRDEVRVVREYFQDELKYGPEALDTVRLHLKEFLNKPPALEESLQACRDELPAGDRYYIEVIPRALRLIVPREHVDPSHTDRSAAHSMG